MKKVISTPNAPKAIGPYSHAVQAGGFVFCAGQIGIDPKTEKLVEGPREQIVQALKNLEAVLKAAGCGFKDIVKLNFYLINLKDFDDVNEICRDYLEAPYPARATVEVAHLPMNASFEVDAVAYKIADNSLL